MFHRPEDEQDKPVNRSGMNCPLYKQPCAEVCHTCELWTFVKVHDPEDKVTSRRWGCALRLAVQIGWDHGQAVASVYEMLEETRAATVDRQDIMLDLMAAGMGAQGQRTLKALLDEKLIERKKLKQIGKA